jgi:predicted small secreted protein
MKYGVFSLLCMILIISGCNTMEGVGRDVKTAGKSLEHTAQKHKSQTDKKN